MREDRGSGIDEQLGRWLNAYTVESADEALYFRLVGRVGEMCRRRRRLPVLFAVIAFAVGAGVSYAAVSEIDAMAMADAMLWYGYRED